MFVLKAAQDISMAPIRAFDVPDEDNVLETEDADKQEGRVKRGLRKVYRKAKMKLQRTPSQSDSVIGDLSDRYLVCT